ncbi:AI-2E family transporter [Sphingomonas sp. NFR15]|uniref:AI-2E family transporter n=1 Tax=Sphingomonas sp. NFR15 TaxID=1566282 RepID=UPI000883C813|nr:AI-2E family transporter [Sphingomonas sp. NFR15]SDA26185.1 Predicted PurR-regulated permease PerM [Sphingomonas sp. NFR15]
MSDHPPLVISAEPGPNELRDPFVRKEMKRAAVWFGVGGTLALVVLLIQPLLIIFGGLVFAAMLDGGVRLLGKVLPIPRAWRLVIVVVLTVIFIVGTGYLTGMQVAAQFEQLRATLMAQAMRLMAWLSSIGLMPGKADINSMIQQALGSFGKLTSWVGTAIGAITSLVMVMVIGLFIAMEPRLYEAGLQWMLPTDTRREFAITVERMAKTMRSLLAGRLLGMALEGVMTGIALAFAGVPMALVLGIITGVLAFIPNIGAIVSGLMMVAVGFSAGVHTGVLAIIIYFVIQTFDGYVVIPMVARKTVDLPPALTLSAQILTGTLFGVLGLALADPMTAMIKVALERNSERTARKDADAAGEADA